MNRSMNQQLTRIACCLLTMVAGTLAVRADDASATAATTNVTTTATETTNVSTNAVETAAADTNTAPAISTTTNVTTTTTETTNESTNAVETAATSPIPAAPSPAVAYQPFSLAAEAGTTGLGGTAGWRFANHFGLQGGMDYFSYSLNKTFNGNNYSGHLRLMSEDFALNLYPWQNRSFHISLGGYVDQNRLTGNANGAITVNGNPYVLPPGETLKLKYQPQSINPYVSVGGNLYFDKARHFSLGGELGAFYLGTPRVSLTDSGATVAASDLAAEQHTIQHDIKKLPVWPILKISVCYSF